MAQTSLVRRLRCQTSDPLTHTAIDHLVALRDILSAHGRLGYIDCEGPRGISATNLCRVLQGSPWVLLRWGIGEIQGCGEEGVAIYTGGGRVITIEGSCRHNFLGIGKRESVAGIAVVIDKSQRLVVNVDVEGVVGRRY